MDENQIQIGTTFNGFSWKIFTKIIDSKMKNTVEKVIFKLPTESKIILKPPYEIESKKEHEGTVVRVLIFLKSKLIHHFRFTIKFKLNIAIKRIFHVKKLKNYDGSIFFPIDCIGEIMSFISNPKTFFNFLIISKYHKNYFENIHPNSCKHVNFILKNSKLLTKSSIAYNYVIKLNFLDKIVKAKDLIKFPNIKIIEFNNIRRYADDYLTGFFKNSKLKELTINGGFFNINLFKHLNNSLKILKLRNNSRLLFKLFEYTANIEELEIVNCFFIKFLDHNEMKMKGLNEDEYILPKFKSLKKLYIEERDRPFTTNILFLKYTDKSLKNIQNLDELKLVGCRRITVDGIKHLNNTKIIKLKDCGIRNRNILFDQGFEKKCIKDFSHAMRFTFAPTERRIDRDAFLVPRYPGVPIKNDENTTSSIKPNFKLIKKSNRKQPPVRFPQQQFQQQLPKVFYQQTQGRYVQQKLLPKKQEIIIENKNEKDINNQKKPRKKI